MILPIEKPERTHFARGHKHPRAHIRARSLHNLKHTPLPRLALQPPHSRAPQLRYRPLHLGVAFRQHVRERSPRLVDRLGGYRNVLEDDRERLEQDLEDLCGERARKQLEQAVPDGGVQRGYGRAQVVGELLQKAVKT